MLFPQPLAYNSTVRSQNIKLFTRLMFCNSVPASQYIEDNSSHVLRLLKRQSLYCDENTILTSQPIHANALATAAECLKQLRSIDKLSHNLTHFATNTGHRNRTIVKGKLLTTLLWPISIILSVVLFDPLSMQLKQLLYMYMFIICLLVIHLIRILFY